jgi:hypothetical protein
MLPKSILNIVSIVELSSGASLRISPSEKGTAMPNKNWSYKDGQLDWIRGNDGKTYKMHSLMFPVEAEETILELLGKLPGDIIVEQPHHFVDGNASVEYWEFQSENEGEKRELSTTEQCLVHCTIGGNGIASNLVDIIGDPNQFKDAEQAKKVLHAMYPDARAKEIYEQWLCWHCIKEARDAAEKALGRPLEGLMI